MKDFDEGLFSCNKTPGLFCFLSLFAYLGGPCCIQGMIISEYTKKHCVYHCAVPCVCLCVGASINRQFLRQKLGLKKSFVNDCIIHLFCNICAVNQEALESNRYRSKGNIILLPIGHKSHEIKQKKSLTTNMLTIEL